MNGKKQRKLQRASYLVNKRILQMQDATMRGDTASAKKYQELARYWLHRADDLQSEIWLNQWKAAQS